jgi:hypothetical protein
MTATQVKTYLENEYGECRHDAEAIVSAIHDTIIDLEKQRVFKVPTKWELFKLLVENEPINYLMTHSYGFHTATGRNIIETLKNYYCERVLDK